MKLQNRLATLMVMSATVLTLANCSSSSKRSEAAATPPAPTPQEQAASRLQTEKDHFVSDTQRRIDEMTKFGADLRNRSAQAANPNSKKMSNAAEDLEALLGDARTRLNEVKSASPENWIDYRRDVDRAMDRASSQYSNSETLFR